jgi:DNA-binding transcriptional ArsR family regulator
MMRIVDENGNSIDARELENSKLQQLSQIRIEILRVLRKEQLYPAQIARKIGLEIQAIYYHIRALEQAGFIEFVEYGQMNGAVAKKYQATDDSYFVKISDNWKQTTYRQKQVPKYFEPFAKSGYFEGVMVVGSPEPHGKYRARASELGMLELCMFLGQYATFDFPMYVLDTQLKVEQRKSNMIMAGGPKVNTAVAEINDSLPIKFEKDNFEVFSTLSGKRYSENIGIIELVDNPYSSGKKILLVSGLNQNGTRAAVIALVKKMNELEVGNDFDRKKLAKVVEGFDEDGDGIVDSIEIKE